MIFLGLPTAKTSDLIEELRQRNMDDPKAHTNHKDQVNEHLRKLRLAFSLREGGLDHRREQIEVWEV